MHPCERGGLPRWSLAIALIALTLAFATGWLAVDAGEAGAQRLRDATRLARGLEIQIDRRASLESRFASAGGGLADRTDRMHALEHIRSHWLEVLSRFQSHLEPDSLRFGITSATAQESSRYQTAHLQLQAELPHEGTLMSLLDELQSASPGQTRLLGCDLHRRADEAGTPAVPGRGLEARCRLQALALREPAQSMDRP